MRGRIGGEIDRSGLGQALKARSGLGQAWVYNYKIRPGMPQPGPARPMDTLSAKVLLAVQNLGDELDVRSMCSMGCDI